MGSADAMRTAKRTAGVSLLAWLVLSALYGGTQPSDGSDLWWSLAAGRHISEVGAVPDQDVFTHTARGLAWHNQEWLAQVLAWQVFDTFGPPGLVMAKLVLVVLFAFVLARLIWRRSDSAFLAVATTSAALLLWGRHLDLRAQLFTFLGTIVLLSLLDAFRRGVRGAGAAIPLLLLLWVDLHYGFIFGLALVLGYFVAETIKSKKQWPTDPLPLPRSLRLGAIFIASTLACLLNPQGVDALLFPFEILDANSPWKRILEWKPPHLWRGGEPQTFLLLLVGQAVLTVLAIWRAPRRIDLTELGIVAVTTVMALSSRRFIPLWGFVGAAFFARNVRILSDALVGNFPTMADFLRRSGAGVTAAIALIATAWIGTMTWTHATSLMGENLFARTTYLNVFPVDAARFLERNRIEGNIYNFYPWGGYLAFHLRQPVYVDGRAHAVFPPEIFYERRQIERRLRGWKKKLAKRNIDIVVHQSAHPLSLALRKMPDWLTIYDDGQASVIVPLSPANAPLRAAFAGGNLWYPPTPGALLFAAQRARAAGDESVLEDTVRRILEADPEDGAAAVLRKMGVEIVAAESGIDPRGQQRAVDLAVALESHAEPAASATAKP